MVSISKTVFHLPSYPLQYTLPILGLILLAIVLYQTRARHLKHLPGPYHYPWIGTIDVAQHKDHMQTYLNDLMNKYKQSFVLAGPHFFVAPVITIAPDPRNSKHMLKDNFYNYDKSLLSDMFNDLFGTGIFASDGSQWRAHRKVASHLFTMNQLKISMFETVLTHGQKFLDRLAQMEPNQAFDLQDLFFRFTLDTFGEIAFGENINCLQKPEMEFHIAFDKAEQLITMRFFDPMFKLKRFLNIGSERVIRDNLKIVNEFIYEVIKHRRHDIAERKAQHGPEKANLITLFLDHAAEQGESMDDDQLRDVVANFMVAGRDTTACCLSWMHYLLTQHPESLKKVKDEIAEELGDALPTYETVKNLKYLGWCVNETLRLYPSVPTDAKAAINEDTLPDGTYIPKGSYVCYAPYIFGRAESIWGKDALQFKPERWEDAQQDEYSFLAFNAGPRLCLGKTLATMEAKTLTAMILQKFELDLVQPQKIEQFTSLTMPVKNGLRMTVRKRVTDEASSN